MKPKNKRRGIIRIDCHFFESDFDIVKKIYSVFVPTKVEYDYMTDAFKCHGYSDLFDEVEYGVEVPYYDIIFTETNKSGEFEDIIKTKITFEFKRI